jgi:magnesium transporter
MKKNEDEKMTDELLKELNADSDKEIEVDNSLTGKVNHPLYPETLKAIVKNRNTSLLQMTVSQYDPHNVSIALNDLEEEDLLFFFKSIKSDDAAPIFTFLSQETKQRVVEAFSSADLQNIVDSMATDNLVDFVDDLPANLVNKVLKATSNEDRARISTYLRFKDDSAGTIMTPEYLSVKDTDTVNDALLKIKTNGKGLETVWEIFVTDNTRRLVGVITLDKLLEADSTDILKSLMKNDFVSVEADTDQEIVLQDFRKYDISVMPVTNSSKRMLGIITFDDVMDVANAENTEDIQLSSAMLPTEQPYLKTPVLKLVKSYSFWIIILLVLNTFTSMAMSYLDSAIATIPLLTPFLTSVMGTNGNASDQTATVIVRELALGNISPKQYFKTAFKEFKAAAITAIVMALFSFGWILVELYCHLVTPSAGDIEVVNTQYGGNYTPFYLSIAAVVSLTFLVVIILAKFLGVSLPMLAKKIHLDPAVMSQPLISNILDVISICFYFLFAATIMKGLVL